MWWRCFYGWEMVLHSVLGGWQINNKVGFIEEEISRGMPFLFFSIWDFLLQCRIAACKTTWCFPLEVSLSWQKRAFTWCWYFPGCFLFSFSLSDPPCSMFWVCSFLLIHVIFVAKVITKADLILCYLFIASCSLKTLAFHKFPRLQFILFKFSNRHKVVRSPCDFDVSVENLENWNASGF